MDTDRFNTIRNRLGAGKLFPTWREVFWDFMENLFHFLIFKKGGNFENVY